jgi:hypothetical protein
VEGGLFEFGSFLWEERGERTNMQARKVVQIWILASLWQWMRLEQHRELIEELRVQRSREDEREQSGCEVC